jgi:hypothetical protein
MRQRHLKRAVVLSSIVMLAGALACKPSTKKLDEAPMYSGPFFTLKAVRYYEKYPMHYNGEVFRIACASPNTQTSPAHKTQDSGWVTLGNGGAIGTRSAQAVVDHERPHYIIVNDTTLAWTGPGLSVSFDGCGSRRYWHPTMLSREEIDTIPKPEYCAPAGTADCRHYDFLGDRQPVYGEITVEPNGTVEFTATSPAFRARRIRVRSTDAGKTWLVAHIE